MSNILDNGSRITRWSFFTWIENYRNLLENVSTPFTDVLGLLSLCCVYLEKLFSPLISSSRVVLLSGRIKCSYFSCLFKDNPVILLPANLLSCSPPLLDLFCMKERIFWLLLVGVRLPWSVWCDVLGEL